MSLILLTCIWCSGYRVCCSSSLRTVLLQSECFFHTLAENLSKVQMYMHENISICTWHVLHVHVLTTPHILLENKVAIQSKLSNLGSIGHILPRLSYCDHYVLCNASLSFSCFSDLRVIKFWRTLSLCFLFSQDTLSGLSHCPLLSTHWAEIWYWLKNLKAIVPSRLQFLAWYTDVFFF